jgi:hypothetical protein
MKPLPYALLTTLLFAASASAQDTITVPIPPYGAPKFGGPFGGGVPGTKAKGKGNMSSDALTPDCPVPWSVNPLDLHGGRQEGVQLILLNNGKMTITIVPTRGMGILDVAYSVEDKDGKKDRRIIGWRSPVDEIVNPSFMNLNSRGGLGFLEGFNEFMCRCGVENIGQPGKDVIVTNTGAKAEVDLTLHGKIANIPARFVEMVVDKQAPFRIRLRGRVDERMMFGTNLVLHTEISTLPGSMEFRIEDKVINKGSQPQEFQMLYHTNIGSPLLEEGARFLAPVTRVIPVNAHSAKDAKTFGDVAGPTPGIIEQAYFMHPVAGKDGNTIALVHNKARDQGLSLRWPVKQLPYLTLWKNTAAIEDGYVIGIEPGTSFPNMRRVERKAGRVPKLDGGKSHTMTIDFGVHFGAAALEPVLDRIDALQRTQAAVIEEAP